MKKQMLAGMATAMTALALAACGNTSTTKESASHQPYEAATTKIKEGHYQEALKTLNDADSSSQKSQVLASDLQNYLAAKTAYNKGNYDQALTSLSTSKSGNESMQTAYQKIRVKIAQATSDDQTAAKSASDESSSQAASSTSSTKKNSASTKSSATKSSASSQSAATTNPSSSGTAANVSAAKATSESVIQKFATKLGFNKSGYGIIPVSQTGDVYRFEVRQSNDDNTVANLIGIYEYNNKTGEVTQVA
ncbi:hypothetical protein [Limosilactobacillus equigenerosi]|uniref:Lipoprotein n=1 Tax=Limosilactobacillus equigenerosi DSM 18793 = JCM 14505 TaxID=1423742 RepID=A0A0R1UP66_9LACO|nr:hypothetical protein [Limosilactobacillus equigenerosi]KRL94612.1 hypothetical protein FC21_GL001346 [Limosilactobacillus equigenerosi DSM 18793 = JCM 14505]